LTSFARDLFGIDAFEGDHNSSVATIHFLFDFGQRAYGGPLSTARLKAGIGQ
jgi:hypothetical protein